MFKSYAGSAALMIAGSLAASAVMAQAPQSGAPVTDAAPVLISSAVQPSFSSSSGELPDAPMPVLTTAPPLEGPELQQSQRAGVAPMPVYRYRKPLAPRYSKYIGSDQRAYKPLTARDKILIGAEDLYSVGNIGAIFFSAGYEQLVNGAPNYGTDKGAFGERLGAAGIRETSQGVFTDMVLSNVLKTDPRYYQLGPQHGYVKRTFYAVSRVFVTRTDSGRQAPNIALLGGYAGSTALQAAYYPPVNRNFKDSASEFGGSIGGAALGNFLTEFAPDILHAIHLDKLHY